MQGYGHVYVWLNGENQLITPFRNPKVGGFDIDSETGAWDTTTNTGVEILSISWDDGQEIPINRVNYNKTIKEKMLEIPLTFEILSDGTIGFKSSGYYDSQEPLTVEYKLNDGEWTEMTISDSDPETINVVSGDTVQFRGDNTNYGDFGCRFFGTSSFNVYGNIMSLIDSVNFLDLKTLQGSEYGYYGTFSGLFTQSNVISANNLQLPATTLAQSCYREMFYSCTSLTTAPELPATTIASYCYYEMFNNCTSLTTAPELPATTLANYCYDGMFYGCTSLTTAPALPATTLASYCYQSMFAGCTSLTQAPELPATTLVEACYQNMFDDCTNLNYIKCLATDISASRCTDGWVNGVASTGTFVKNHDMSSWTTGTSGIPEGWTVESV